MKGKKNYELNYLFCIYANIHKKTDHVLAENYQ